MKFVDAHIHLSDEEYEGHIEEIISDAEKAHVAALISNSMDLKTSIRSLSLAKQYPHRVYASVGIHPWTVSTLEEKELHEAVNLVAEQVANGSVIAIGEVGLDSKYDEKWDKQIEVFDAMLQLAEEYELPAIIHSRGTTEKIIEMLQSYRIGKILLHWFSYPLSVLDKIIEQGYYISEGVPACFSEGIRAIVKNAPLGSLLTETDGPVQFFKPPFKGRMTTPAFIPQVVQSMAEIKNLKVEEVASQVVKNFEALFGVSLN